MIHRRDDRARAEAAALRPPARSGACRSSSRTLGPPSGRPRASGHPVSSQPPPRSPTTTPTSWAAFAGPGSSSWAGPTSPSSARPSPPSRSPTARPQPVGPFALDRRVLGRLGGRRRRGHVRSPTPPTAEAPYGSRQPLRSRRPQASRGRVSRAGQRRGLDGRHRRGPSPGPCETPPPSWTCSPGPSPATPTPPRRCGARSPMRSAAPRAGCGSGSSTTPPVTPSRRP